MSSQNIYRLLQAINSKSSGYILKNDTDAILIAWGDTVPTSGTYAVGAIFMHTDGGAATALYINEGTEASVDFNPVVSMEGFTGTPSDLNTWGDVTATAAELNSWADQSANTEDISAAGAVSITTRASQIAGGEGYAVTLAAPTAAQVGKLKVITLESITSGAVTMALTEVIGGSAGTSASFDAAGETLTLVAIESAPATFKWLVLDEHGVTLS